MKTYATDKEAESIPDEQTTNCCGAESQSNGDSSTKDFGICPDCQDNCCYGYYDENNEEWFYDKEKKQFYQNKQ